MFLPYFFLDMLKTFNVINSCFIHIIDIIFREFCWAICFGYYVNITSYKIVYIDIISVTLYSFPNTLVRSLEDSYWWVNDLSVVEVRFFKEFGQHEWLRTWDNWLSVCLVARIFSSSEQLHYLVVFERITLRLELVLPSTS